MERQEELLKQNREAQMVVEEMSGRYIALPRRNIIHGVKSRVYLTRRADS